MKTIFKLSVALVSLAIAASAYAADASKSESKKPVKTVQEADKQLTKLQHRLDLAHGEKVEAVLKEIESQKLISQIKFGKAGITACMICDVSSLQKLAPHLTVQDLASCVGMLRQMDPTQYSGSPLEIEELIKKQNKCKDIVSTLMIKKMEADPKYAEALKAGREKAAQLMNKS